jgi:hypothetical protein
MSNERPSSPPTSIAAPTSEWQSIRFGAMREYRDEALLDRVHGRFSPSVSRKARSRAVWQAAAALVLFGVGVGVGRGLPSVTAHDATGPLAVRATAEISRTGIAAAPRARTLDHRDSRAALPPRRTEHKRIASVSSPEVPPTVVGDAASPLELEIVDVPVPTVVPSLRSTWLELADAGDYSGALGELERSQVAHLVLATGSVEELMTMAEVARFAGSQERAIQALSQVVDRYGGDPNAPLAAMMLGNLLSRSGDSAGAAKAFALNRRLSPGGDFAEDALVREFDLALAAGDAELASSLFDQYAREFPAGPRVFAMRYELDELLADSQGTPGETEPVDAQGRSDTQPDGSSTDQTQTQPHDKN